MYIWPRIYRLVPLHFHLDWCGRHGSLLQGISLALSNIHSITPRFLQPWRSKNAPSTPRGGQWSTDSRIIVLTVGGLFSFWLLKSILFEQLD
ncbi:hypothetical protein NPIL_582051 [Nephila pilipes]|uniref:Uncharacterized protein n=1 Tax=Nephila pilipes TaxID=299642 RepID=A0A8X6M760_NEPPI|nr:hypothetical protein NPIL_582051 [Nephila pilipes]